MSTTVTIKKERKIKEPKSPKIPKKLKKQMEEQQESCESKDNEEKKERKTKKMSKFISKQSCAVENNDILIPDTNNNMIETNKKTVIPNVVVCFRCQLSDLQQTEQEETIIENKPFEYKAWVSSGFK